MLKDWIQLARDKGASDLHIEAGTPLVLRIRGELIPVGNLIAPELLLQTTKELLGQQLWQDFSERRSVDLSHTIAGTRCRINVYQTYRGISLAIRLLYSFHNNLKDCNLHSDLRRLLKFDTGLIIISGPTGSGKSTTLAAMIEEINTSERRQILTIESPIEYYYTNRQSFVRQREVMNHTPSYEQAIVDAMREDPDVLVITEMRTPDVMRLTLNAAETGHLVLATMHSSTSAEALSRICMSFPAEIQGSIRAQLADCLVGVVCQRLLYLPQYQLRVPHCEVLIPNSGSKSTIRSGQFSQIISSIQTGGEEGMWSFDRYQRWIEQKKDWVRPKQEVTSERETSVPSYSIPFETKRVAPQKASQAVPASAKATPKKTPQTSKEEPLADDGRIEIVGEDEDLETIGKQLAEKFGDEDSN